MFRFYKYLAIHKLRLSDPVSTIPLVGPKYVKLLEKLEVFTIKDLLYHVPVSYKDSSRLSKISELEQGKSYTIRAVINDIRNIRLRGGRTMQRANASDDSEAIDIVWFNQPFLLNSIKEGTELLLSGKLSPKSLVPQLSSPQYEILRSNTPESVHLGRIAPIYHLTGGISPKWLRNRIKWLYDNIDLITDLEDQLPADIKQKYGLIDLIDAISKIHFSKDLEDITSARKRLAYDELLEIYFKLFKLREERILESAPRLKNANKFITEVRKNIKFTLTPTQEQATAEIYADFAKDYPMKRLLQGDVGSGKTIVAALAALPLIASGYQVVLMVPTTVLANQHYQNLSKILPKKIKIGLLTSTSLKSIKALGKIDLFISTQAILFHKEELLSNLGLIIIDEQHRFGVNQRRDLLNLKNDNHS